MLVGLPVHRNGAKCGVFYLHGQILVPSRLTLLPCGLGVDQHSRIEQALRIQGCLGGLKGSGEQRRALAIVPPPMVAPDRMMVGDRAAICNHSIKTGRLDGVPLRAQLAMPSGVQSEVWRRPVRIHMGATAGYLAGTPGCLDDGALGRCLDPVVDDSNRSQVIAVSNVSLMMPR